MGSWALEALRNALYKFKTYLLTSDIMCRVGRKFVLMSINVAVTLPCGCGLLVSCPDSYK